MARSAATTVGSTGSEWTDNVRHTAQGGGALFVAAKVERAADAEFPQDGGIVVGEMAEMVGTEYLSPAHGPAVARGIAAEIAEIAGAGQIEMAGGEG